jgi:hypothetical protein
MILQEIASAADFRAAVHAALAAAAERQARTLWLVDPHFADWPLDDPALLDALGAFVRRPGRRVVMVAESFDRIARQHPRFTAWRGTWAPAVDAREPSEPVGDGLPTLLLDDGPVVLELHDREHWRGRAQRDAPTAALVRDRIDAWLQRSVPAWPVRPLGL